MKSDVEVKYSNPHAKCVAMKFHYFFLKVNVEEAQEHIKNKIKTHAFCICLRNKGNQAKVKIAKMT